MEIPLEKRNYRVPILIFILKTIPYESPKFFLEIVSGPACNYKNKIININSDTDRIITKSLINWTKDTNIINAMNEIFDSFIAVFPIYLFKNNLSNNNKILIYLKKLLEDNYLKNGCFSLCRRVIYAGNNDNKILEKDGTIIDLSKEAIKTERQ